MQAASTIYIREDLKEKLQALKQHPRESYNDVIERLVTLAVDQDPLNDEAIKGLEEALEDIRRHRLHSEAEIMAEFRCGMSYRIKYTSRARKDLHKLDRALAQRIIRALHGLTDHPHSQIKKLKGTNPGHPLYTFRIGTQCRVILSIHDTVLVIQVLEIEDRKQVYRDF